MSRVQKIPTVAIERMRDVKQLLTFYAENKQTLNPSQLAAITRNLGVAFRMGRRDNMVDINDDRFREIIQCQTATVQNLPAPAIADLAEAINTFPPRNRLEPLLLPLADKLSSRVIDLAREMSPDELTLSIRALCATRERCKTVLNDRGFAELTSSINRQLPSFAHHNCRMVLQAMHFWPWASDTTKTAHAVLNRLRSVVDNVTGVDAVRTLITILTAPNFIRNYRSDVKTKLVYSIFRGWNNLNSNAKVDAVKIIASRGRDILRLNGELTKNMHILMTNLADELSVENASDFILSAAYLDKNIPQLSVLIEKFATQRLAAASLYEKVDVLWAMARMHGKDPVVFEKSTFDKVFTSAISSFRVDESNPAVLAKLLDVVVFAGPDATVPGSIQALLTDADSKRVTVELASKNGRVIESALAQVKSEAFSPLKLRCNVPMGSYRVAFFDDAQKIAVDFEPRDFFMCNSQRQKNMDDRGIKFVTIPDEGFGSSGPAAYVQRILESRVKMTEVKE